MEPTDQSDYLAHVNDVLSVEMHSQAHWLSRAASLSLLFVLHLIPSFVLVTVHFLILQKLQQLIETCG